MATGLISVKDFGAVGDGTTADQSALIAAITAAKEANSDLYWPGGRYLSTATLPDVHSVVNIGSGIIVRKNTLGDDFEFCPGQWIEERINRLFVNAVGSDDYDGLTPTRPVKSIQKAINLVFERRPNLTCEWEIQVASGTYLPASIPGGEGKRITSIYPFRIIGEDVGIHPNVPTTIIARPGNLLSAGLHSLDCDLRVENILFKDFNNSTSAAGIAISRHILYTSNVHFQNCFYGITAGDHSVLDIKGGIFDNCGYLNGDKTKGTGHAIRSIFLTKWAVGNQHEKDLTLGPFIRNCAGAARVQELCTGHLDYVAIEDCQSGLRISVNSRLNIGGSSFKRISGTAVECSEGSYAHKNSATIFGAGVDKNGRDFEVGINSSSSTGAFGDINMNVARARNLISFRTRFNVPPISATGPSNNIDVFTLAANFFNDDASIYTPAKKIALIVKGSTSGTAGTKSISIRLGPDNALTSTIPKIATGNFHIEFSIQFIGPSAQILSSMRTLAYDGTSIPAQTAHSVDMSIAHPLRLNAWVENAADSLTILSYEWLEQGF